MNSFKIFIIVVILSTIPSVEPKRVFKKFSNVPTKLFTVVGPAGPKMGGKEQLATDNEHLECLKKWYLPLK